VAGIARCVARIHELGALVKDLDDGLVDFPARRGDEHVLLCWCLGEDAIEFWHGPDEGYSGRNRNDVWHSADGVRWHQVPDTPWAPRHAASVCA